MHKAPLTRLEACVQGIALRNTLSCVFERMKRKVVVKRPGQVLLKRFFFLFLSAADLKIERETLRGYKKIHRWISTQAHTFSAKP